MDSKTSFDEIKIYEGEAPVEIKKNWLLEYRGNSSIDEMQQKQMEGKLYTTPLLKAMLMSYYKRNCWNNPEAKDKYLIIKNGGNTDEFDHLKDSLMLNEQNYGRIKVLRKFCIKKYGIMGKLSRRWFIFKGTNLAVYHSALEDSKPKIYSLIGATYEIEEFNTHNLKTPWHSPVEYINENGNVEFTEARYRLSVVTREPKARHFSLYSNLKDEISDWVKIFHVANLNLDQNQAALISHVITRIVQRDLPVAWDALTHEAENRAHRETMLKCFVNRLKYLNATRVINKWIKSYESQNKDRDLGLKLLGREVMLGRLYHKYKKHAKPNDQKESTIELIQEGFRYEKTKRQKQIRVFSEENPSDDLVSFEATYAGTQIKQGKEGRNFQTVYFVNPDLKQYLTSKNAKSLPNEKYSLISSSLENSLVKISKDLSKVLWRPNKWNKFEKYMHIDVESISCIILNAEKPYYVKNSLEKLPNLQEEFKIAEYSDKLIHNSGDACFLSNNDFKITKYKPSSGNWLAICGPRLGFNPAFSPEHIIRCAKLNILMINFNIKSVSFNDKFARLYTGYFQYYARKIQEISSYEKSSTLSALNYGDHDDEKSLNTIKSFMSNIVENDKNLAALESNIENVRKLFTAVSMIENDSNESQKVLAPSNSTISSVKNLFTKKSTNIELGSSPSRTLTKSVTALGIKSRNLDENLVAPPDLSVIDPFQTIMVDKANDIRESTVQSYLIITAFQQSYTSPFAVGMNPTYDVNFTVDVPLISSDKFNIEGIENKRYEVLKEAICSVELWVKSPIESIPDELIGSVNIPLSELAYKDQIEKNTIIITPVDSFVLKQPVPDSKIMCDSDEKAVYILKNLGILVNESESIESSPLGQLDISIDSSMNMSDLNTNPISPETICLGGLQSISSYTYTQSGINVKYGDCVELYIAQLTLSNNWTNGLYFVEVVMGDISCITHLVQTTYETPYVDFRSHLYIPRYDNKIGFNSNCLQILIRRAIGTEEKCSSLARLVEESVIMGEILVGIDSLKINEPHSNYGVYLVYKPSYSSKYGSKGLDYAVKMTSKTENNSELDELKESFLPGVKLTMMLTMRRKTDVILKKIIEQSEDFKLVGDTALLIVEEELKYPISPLEFHEKNCPGEFEPSKAGMIGLPLRPISNYMEFELNGFYNNDSEVSNSSPRDYGSDSESIIDQELSAFMVSPVPLHVKDPVPAEFYLPENPKEFKDRKLPGLWHRIINDGFTPGNRVTRLTHRVRYVPVTIIAIYKNRTALCKWSEFINVNPREFPEGCVFIPEQRLVMGVPISFLTTPHQSGVHVYDSLITRFPDNIINISNNMFYYGGYLPMEVNPIFCKYEYIFWINTDTKIQMVLWTTIIKNAIRERAYNKIKAYQRIVDLMNDQNTNNSDCQIVDKVYNTKTEDYYPNKGELQIVINKTKIISRKNSPSSFYVTFQWARLPEKLLYIIQSELNYDLKVALRQAISRIIEETIISLNLPKKVEQISNIFDSSLRPINISKAIAILHSSYIPFNLSSQIVIDKNNNSAESLKDEFINLVQQISFSSYYCSTTYKNVDPLDVSPYTKGSKDDKLIYSISGELTGLLPQKALNNTGNIYKTYISDFSKLPSCCEQGGYQFATSEILSEDEVPILVFKVFEEVKENNDVLIGHITLNSSDFMKFEKPFNLKYKQITPKYQYIVSASGSGGKKFSFESIPEALSFTLAQNSEITVEEFYRALYGETNQARRINGPWRVRVQENNDYHGYISLMIRFGPSDLTKLSEFQPTIYDYKEHELDSHRKQFDSSIMPFIKTPYDPNTPLSIHLSRVYSKKFRQLNGKIEDLIVKFRNDEKMIKLLVLFLTRPSQQWVYERCIYEHMMLLEPLTNLIEQQNMRRWKYLLADSSQKGIDQWEKLYRQGLLLHKVDELSDNSWSILVNATLKNKLPLVMIEVWNGDEFLGECLLPSLPSLLLNKINRLIKLDLDQNQINNNITRFDIRKDSYYSSDLNIYINMQVSWVIKSTTEGILSINIKDIRNIKSNLTEDLNDITPRVHVYEYYTENNSWRLIAVTHSGVAARTLIGINNLDQSNNLNTEWKNIFLFNKERYINLELPIPIPAMVEKVQNILNFSDIILNPDNNDKSRFFVGNIWKLIKSGIPNYYRPYVWMQLSGAHDLRETIHKKWIALSDETRCGHDSLFKYLVEFSERCNSCVLQQLDEDIESAKIKYHICESVLGIDQIQFFWHNLRAVSRALIVFSFRKKYNVFNCEKFRVGLPLQYTFGILSLTVQLLMNYGGVCLTPEDTFYLIYSVCGSKYNLVNNDLKKSLSVQGSLLPYFTSYKDSTQDEYNKMPAQILDIIFLRSALELLLPVEVDNIMSAGFQLEEIFYAALTSLFAGFLPTSAIAQLYDMIFNIYFQPKNIFETKNTEHEEVEVLIPMSRRIMICLCYHIITETCREMSYTSLLSSKSIRDTIYSIMATMTDPLEIVNGIEKADFMIFGNKQKFNVISKLYNTYVISFQDSLWFAERQNLVLENIINTTTLQFQHGSDAPSHVGMRFINGRYVPKTVVSPGLSIRDLREAIYPLIKFQALYAGRNLHQLPPNVSGYIIIKIDEVREFASYDAPIAPVICVKMDQYKVATDPATERCSKSFIWKSNNVFMFPIPTWKPTIKKFSKKNRNVRNIGEDDEEEELPPQTVEITIEVLDSEALDEENKVLSSAQVSFDRWSSSGGNLQLNNDDETLGIFNNCNNMSLLFSWYTYVPNSELETSSLLPFSFGKQQWGDYGGFHPIYTSIDLEFFRDQMYPENKEENIKSWMNEKRQSILDIIRGRRVLNEEGGDLNTAPTVKSMYPSKLEINTGRYGPTRSQLQQLFFFSAPSLLPYVNDIVESFAKVPDYYTEEKVSLTAVPLREFISSIILCSRGTISEKAELLFDLFGYDDSNRASSAFQCMYYAHVPQYPSAIQVGSQLIPHLPLEISDKLGAPTANVISLAGIAAIVQTSCIRANIPLDNVGIYQITASVFDHYFDVPSILKALIIPPAGFDGRTSKEYAIHDSSRLKYSYDLSNNTGLFSNCGACTAETNYSLDVTRILLNHIRRNAAVEGLFGIDFSVHNCFRHFDINDPFPGIEKTLRIIICGKRSKQELRVIDLDVDNKGHFTNANVQFNIGSGDNLSSTNSSGGSRIRDAFDAGLTTVDFPRLSFDGSLQPKEKVSSASFVFNLHNILVDKYSFVTKFCDFSLVTEAIRRVTANDRTCEPNQYLKVNVEVDVSFKDPKSLPHYSIDEILGIPAKINTNSVLLDNNTSDTLVNVMNTIDDINCSTERFSPRFEQLVSVHTENPGLDKSETIISQLTHFESSSKLLKVQNTTDNNTTKENLYISDTDNKNNKEKLGDNEKRSKSNSNDNLLVTNLDLDNLSIAQSSARQQLMSTSSRRINSQTSVLSAISRGPSTGNLYRVFTSENLGTYYSPDGCNDYKVDIPFRPPGQVEERHHIRVYLADSIRVLKSKVMDAARCITQKLNEAGLDSTLYDEIKISPQDKVELVVNDFDGHIRYIPLSDESASIDDYIRSNQDLLQDFIVSNGDSIINIRITPDDSQLKRLKTNAHEMQHGGGALITSMYLANEMANNEILEKGMLIRNVLGIPTYYNNSKYIVSDKYIEIEPGKIVPLDNLCYIKKSSAILSATSFSINTTNDKYEWIPAVAIRGINTFINEIEGKFNEEERGRTSRIPQGIMNISSVVGGFMPVTLGAYNPIAAAFDYGMSGPSARTNLTRKSMNTMKSANSNIRKAAIKKVENNQFEFTRLKQNQLINPNHGWDMSFEVVLLDFHDLMVEGRIQTRESICVSDTDIIFCFREPSVMKQFEITSLTSDEKIRITSLYETGMCPQRIALELSEDRVAALKSGSYPVFYNYQPNAVYVSDELILKFLSRYRSAIEEDKQLMDI